MNRDLRLSLAVVPAAIVAAMASLGAQLETMRIRGQVLVEGAGPLAAARVTTDAIRGPNASQFVGQRTFTVRAGRDGEWSMLGVTRGLWILEVSAVDHAPHVIVVPIAMMLKPALAPWDTSLALLPMRIVAPGASARAGPLRSIVEAIEKGAAGDRAGAREALLRLEDTALSPEALCAAGDAALLVRQPVLARKFFELAATARPDWYRPHLGIASASLMNFDFDRAMKAFGPARSMTANNRLERMISGAIRDLQQIRTIGGTFVMDDVTRAGRDSGRCCGRVLLERK